MVCNKYKRAEGCKLKEQPEGGGGRLPATNCGYRGRKGGRVVPPGITGRRGIMRIIILIDNMGKDHRRHQSVGRRCTWEGEETRMRTENTFHRLR